MSDSPSIAELESRLIAIGQRMDNASLGTPRHPDQNHMAEWSGADVRVTSDFAHEPQGFVDSHDLLVRTQHAGMLTWMFLEVRDSFGSLLDASNKYGFYGSLARAALEHLAAHQPESDDPRPLLRAVIARAFDWLQVLRDEGEIPPNAQFVIHTRDSEGRQRRTDRETGEETH